MLIKETLQRKYIQGNGNGWTNGEYTQTLIITWLNNNAQITTGKKIMPNFEKKIKLKILEDKMLGLSDFKAL